MLLVVLLQGVQDVLGGLGLGAIAGQLADLQLGELLDTPPPGLDEAVAIAKASHTRNMHGSPCASHVCLPLHTRWPYAHSLGPAAFDCLRLACLQAKSLHQTLSTT